MYAELRGSPLASVLILRVKCYEENYSDEWKREKGQGLVIGQIHRYIPEDDACSSHETIAQASVWYMKYVRDMQQQADIFCAMTAHCTRANTAFHIISLSMSLRFTKAT